MNFYPRSPCGERPCAVGAYVLYICISIHALLAESDAIRKCQIIPIIHFYPRSPCGERPPPYYNLMIHQKFLSTLSLRRATVKRCQALDISAISIHALLAESDVNKIPYQRQIHQFLSTLSLRRATYPESAPCEAPIFLSTLSLRRATAKVHKTVGHFCAYETNFMEIASSC